MKSQLSTEEEQIALEEVMDNYKNPQNFGVLKDHTFFKHQKNAHCGDVFDLYVKLNDKKKIIDVKYTGEGCAISTASFSMLSEKLIGMKLKDARKLSDSDMYKIFKIPISPSRINCAMLSLNAFHNGLEHYEFAYK